MEYNVVDVVLCLINIPSCRSIGISVIITIQCISDSKASEVSCSVIGIRNNQQAITYSNAITTAIVCNSCRSPVWNNYICRRAKIRPCTSYILT